MLKSLIYVSSAAPSFAQSDIEGILESSRRNNPRIDVTGMLLFADGSFFQVLEGPAGAVEETFRRIELDPRHNGVLRLFEQEIAERDFPDWSMGYRPNAGAALPPGAFKLRKPEIQALEARDIGIEVLTLMKTFYKSVLMHEA